MHKSTTSHLCTLLMLTVPALEEIPFTSLSHKMGVKTEMLFEKFSKIFLGSKNAGSERIMHSLPAEDLALLTLVISAWQS